MWPQGFLEPSWEITSLVLASVLRVKKNSSQRGTRLCPESQYASGGAGARAVVPAWHPLGTAPRSSVVWGSTAGESSACLLTEEASGRPGWPQCSFPRNPCIRQPTRSAEASPGPGCARPPLCACVAPCPGSGCSSAEIPEDLPPGQCRVVQELCAVVVLVRVCLKQNKTGGLCFAWMRGDSAVPGSLREVPREVNVAGPPRGCRLCVHSLVGAPAVGMGCPLPRLLTNLLCTCQLKKQTIYNIGLYLIQQTF